MGGASFRAPLACANGVVIRVSLHGPRLMSEVVGDIRAMTATALHILPDTSSRGGDHTSNSALVAVYDVRVTEDQASELCSLG